MGATLRLATPADAEQILAIYAPIVRNTAISFEVEPPTVDEMRRRIAGMLAWMPWLVCELSLKIPSGPPTPPVEIRVVRESPAWHAALATGLPFLRA